MQEQMIRSLKLIQKWKEKEINQYITERSRHRKNDGYMRATIYVIICLLLSVIIGTILMISVYCLPVSRMRENARKSLAIYELEGDYYRWAPDYESSQLDNFTDSLMINNAIFLGRDSVVYDAMTNPFVTYDDLAAWTECMIRTAGQDNQEGRINDYARYWHGYLVWLKPMLMIFTMSDIRVLSMCFQFIVLVGVILELYKAGGYRSVIPFVFAILTINPISTALCMQYACVYCIMLLSVYIMLKFRIYNLKEYWKLFLWIGIATAFFDFLTYPIVGLAITLGVQLSLQNESFALQIRRIIKASFIWAIGYGGMWTGKWMVASVLIGYNVFAEGIANVKVRTSGSIGESIVNNSRQLCNMPILFLLVILVVITIGLKLTGRYRFVFCRKHFMGMMLISLYPFIWYSIVRNHSAIHAWMTYRNLSITMFAVSDIILNSVVDISRQEST